MPDTLPLSARRAILALSVATLLVWTFAHGAPTGVGAEDMAFVTVVGVAAVCLVVLVAAAPLGLWSGGPLFFVVLVIFHVPLPAFRLLDAEVPGDDAGYVALWFVSNDQVVRAVWLVAQAMLAFTLGYLLLSRRREGDPFRDRRLGASAATGMGASLSTVGTVIVVATVGYVLGTIALTEPRLFLGQGGKRLYDATIAANPSLTVGAMGILVGTSLVAAGAPSVIRMIGLSSFGLFAVSTLVMGSRSSALYAIVGLVVVLARLRPMPRQIVAVVAVLAGLVVVNGVQQVRDTGLAETGIREILGSPLAATVEMGSTLRPVIETVSWFDDGETHRLGETFVAGPIRFGELVAGVDRPYSATDPRLVGTLLRDRVQHYEIGYSIVAEGFLNFGAAGSAVFFVGLGLLFGRWDGRRLGSRAVAALYGVVFTAVLATVRQSASITLTTCLVGTAAVAVAWWLASVRARRVGPETPGAEA